MTTNQSRKDGTENDATDRFGKRRDYWVNVERAVMQFHPDDRAEALHQFRIMANQGHQAVSIYSYALALLKCSRVLGATSFREATPGDFVRVVAWMKQHQAPATAHMYAALLRTYWKLTNPDVEDMPVALKRALSCKRPRANVVGQVIPEADFRLLLEACRGEDGGRFSAYPHRERAEAPLWLLRASGFRISEALSLRRDSLSFEDDGTLRLELPKDAPSLKTGPRTIYIAGPALPILRAWLDINPNQAPDGPLFCRFPRTASWQPMNYWNADLLLRRLQCRVGLQPKGGRYSAHDFRHTCATEKARLGWNEAQMRAFFGWAPDSAMPSIYCHLTLDDQRARIRDDERSRQAGAAAITPDPSALARQIMDALQRLAGQQPATTAA